jgi:hypothetical protein
VYVSGQATNERAIPRAPTFGIVQVVLGAVLAFVVSLILQWRERRASLRSNVYLDLLPALEQRAAHYHRVAAQDPRNAAQWSLPDDDWPYPTEADALYRTAVLSGSRDRQMARDIRDRWMTFAKGIDPDFGSPTEQIRNVDKVEHQTERVLDAIGDYTKWLEQRARGRRLLRPR